MENSKKKENETKSETPVKQKGSYFDSVLEDPTEKHGRHIRFAQVALILVAIITLYFSITGWLHLGKVSMYISNETAAEARLALGVTFLIGLLFLGLFFWANKNPFAACLTAFLFYVGDFILEYALNPKEIPRSNIVKIVIVLALLKGIHSGWLYRKLRKEEAE
jgi:hypothetical protein